MIRFGLQLPSFTFPGLPDEMLFDRISEIATAAEDSGFESLFVMDHFQQIANIGPPEHPMFEAYTLLGAVAAGTSRVRLGALVSGVTYRNPSLLAKILTTLDVISGGRAILGIGAAWNEKEAREYGYDWPSTRERMERLEDAIQICRAMFTQEVATFEGRHHHIRGALNFPRPVQPGGPKIMVGGSGEQRTLRLVARYADAWNLFGDDDTIRHKLAVLEQHCRDVARDPAENTKTRLGTLVIADTQEEAEARLEERRAAGVDPERLRTYVVGDPDTVSHQVQAYFDAGLDGLIFNMPPGTAPEIVSLGGRTLTERFGSAA
jgi:F420-dependent oxidoreductase-like protein